MKFVCPTKSPLEAVGQKLNSDRRPCLHSEKEGRFCTFFEHLMAYPISGKSVDKVLELLWWSKSCSFKVIYWVKSRSQEGGKS